MLMYINICIYRYRQWKGDCVFMHAYFFALDSNTSKKKIFSGNNLSSGTRYYSHFFKEHFLHFWSHKKPSSPSSPPLQREGQNKEKGAGYDILPSLKPLERQVFHKELQHRRKGAVILWHCLRYSVNISLMIELPPVPSPKSKDKNQAALHAHTATTCKNTPPCKEQNTQMCG